MNWLIRTLEDVRALVAEIALIAVYVLFLISAVHISIAARDFAAIVHSLIGYGQ